MLRDKVRPRASLRAPPVRAGTRHARRPAARTLCQPLDSLQALLGWRPTASAARCVSRVPLPDSAVARFVRPGTLRANATAAARTTTATKRIQPPRLLMCHEFGDGYRPAEAAADGVTGSDCPDDRDLWRFNHWAYVDVFVYASTRFVSIPPVGYIHAGHRHGALVLGCCHFDGQALSEIVSSFSTRTKVCQQLATIAKFFGFDGWLIRVDSLPSDIKSSDISSFVSDVTRSCRKSLGAACEVVWFDSITRKGIQRPQNELNDENDPFFKAAGAIFTGFHWSRNAPVRSAVKAGPRRTDVFTGIDVHGRRTFGGGGFQTHIALRAIKQAGTSAAIFAPSWTVESCPNEMDPVEMEERFWTGPRGRFGRECVAQYFKERAVLTQLPFTTFFDPGWGPRTVSAGNVVSDERYFSMKRQDVQPSFLRTKPASGDGAAATLALSHEQALNGSASVRLSFSFSESRMLTGTYSVLRFFIANVTFPKMQRNVSDRMGALRVTYQYLVDDKQQVLRASNAVNRGRRYGGGGMEEEEDDGSTAAREMGANQFGLLLLFAAPMRAVMLVGEKSRWYTGPEEAMQRAAPRLEILDKFVDYIAVPPAREHPVRGAPARNDGSPSWMSRTFEIPANLLHGQRLQEVMVIVGEPPLQPISVRPSPLVTPRSHSRVASFRSNMVQASGFESPMEQQQLLTSNSRSNSFRSSVTPRTKLGAELFNAGILDGNDPTLNRRLSRAESLTRAESINSGISGRKFGSRHGSALTEEDNNSECGSDASDRSSQKSFRSYSSTARMRRQLSAKESRGTRMDDLDYEANFQVDGSVDFSHMQADVLQQSASRAISRLGSRLGTPDGGRYRYTSSRASSRVQSRNPSRAMSPAATPVRTYSARANSMVFGEDKLLGRRPLGSGSAVLADLKASLMSAADSMAAGAGDLGAGADDTGVGRRARATNKPASQRIFLGGLALEIVDDYAN